eukprot:PITA_08589
MNPTLKDIVKEELQKLQDAGFIYPISDSEWVSPLVLVPKKNGKWRICVDYRELNKATKKDHFPLPFIDQVLDGLVGKKFFYFLDGFSGWLLLLQQFDLTIVDKLGKENVVVDFLSRLDFPVGEEGMVDDQMPDEHLFSIPVLSPSFANIANYLASAQFPPYLSSKEKSKIVRKSAPFTWIGVNLFKLGPDQIFRQCVREEEVFDILLTCHDGPYRGHFSAKRNSFKIVQAGYYWPTLHRDVRRYINQCDRCQRMGKRTRKDEMPLHP